jgi:hypothetical protein
VCCMRIDLKICISCSNQGGQLSTQRHPDGWLLLLLLLLQPLVFAAASGALPALLHTHSAPWQYTTTSYCPAAVDASRCANMLQTAELLLLATALLLRTRMPCCLCAFDAGTTELEVAYCLVACTAAARPCCCCCCCCCCCWACCV